MADAEPFDRAAYLPDADALVVADLHLGRDADSNVQLPLGEAENVAERLAGLLDRFEPAIVVFAGDVLHAFDRIPAGVEESLDTLRAAVADVGARLVVTPGNHDGLLAATDLECHDEFRLPDGTVVCHGHDAPETDADRYVVGHDHPAIRIEGTKHPCYLLGDGTYRDADVVVLPSFNPLVRGTVVNSMSRRDFGSPVVADGDPIGAYRPVVWDEATGEALEFPPLSEFRRLL